MSQDELLRRLTGALSQNERDLFGAWVLARMLELVTMQRGADTDREFYGRIQELAYLYQSIMAKQIDGMINL